MNQKKPSQTPQIPAAQMEKALRDIKETRNLLEKYAEHLRGLDLRRLKGVRAPTLGFVGAATQSAEANAAFVPPWLSPEIMRERLARHNMLSQMHEMAEQVAELLWKMMRSEGDAMVSGAQEYYNALREAVKSGVAGSETLLNQLAPFYKSHGRRDNSKITEKKLMRDAEGLLDGEKDGFIVIENESPRLLGGLHKKLDESFDKDG